MKETVEGFCHENGYGKILKFSHISRSKSFALFALRGCICEFVFTAFNQEDLEKYSLK
jgi:hypothetical protein